MPVVWCALLLLFFLSRLLRVLRSGSCLRADITALIFALAGIRPCIQVIIFILTLTVDCLILQLYALNRCESQIKQNEAITD